MKKEKLNGDRATQRLFFASAKVVLIGALLCSSLLLVAQQSAPTSAGPADPKLIEDLLAANRILYQQGVNDAFGHVSVRHDRNPNRFILSRSRAPELVSLDDLIEYDL